MMQHIDEFYRFRTVARGLGRLAVGFGLVYLAAAPPALAETVIAGPVAARVEQVVDGDSIRVRAAIWPNQEVLVSVRVAGVDTPEISRPLCARERQAGERARALVERLVAPGRIALRDVRLGKYAGRVVATVVLPDGRDLARVLIDEAALGVPYDGGRKTRPWCGRDGVADDAK